MKSTIEHQIPKAQTKPYRAYHKAAQSKERGKKKAKNTVKQKIMILSLLIEPLEKWICYLLMAKPGVALRILQAFSFTSFGNCGSLRNCGQRGRLNTKDTNNFLSSPLVGLKKWTMGRIYSD